MTADYDLPEAEGTTSLGRESKTVESFAIPVQYANIKAGEHLFGDYEYIAALELYCSKGIEFIRIRTSKEHTIEIGNPRSVPRCKLYSFEIGPQEKPIALMGVIENRKTGGENREVLVSLGLELRRKEIFVRGRGRRGDSSLSRPSALQNPTDQRNT